MKARNYTKRVEIWETILAADGYGGNTVTTALINESWANIKTMNSRNAGRFKDLGIIDPLNTIIVTMRWRIDLSYNAVNQFLRYNGMNYVIQNAPMYVEYLGSNEVELIAVRQMTTSVTQITT